MSSRSFTGYTFIALATVLTVVLLTWRPFAAEAVYPVENAERAFRTGVLARLSGALHGAEAAVENARLRREVASLAVLRGDLDRLEAENARLRRSLGYLERNPGRWLAAGVLSRGGASAAVRRVLRVDRGALHGVREGAVVTVPEGLVGIVTAVSPHTAEITPLTDPSVRVACEVEAAGAKASGVLSGGDELLVLKHYFAAGEVPPRARVLTSGRGGVFPRGIEVGTFNGVRKGADNLACEGEVLPGVDFATLEDVFIRREE